MKKFTKIATLLTTATLLASTALFAACDDQNKPKPNDGNEQTAYAKGLSDRTYEFEKEYFYDDYNTEAKNSSIEGEATVFDTKDDIVFEAITYDRLLDILESEGNYLLFFGGAWCHNTRAAARYVNQYANEYGITAIYNYDFQLDGRALNKGDTYNSRVSDEAAGATPTAGQKYNYLYGELINHYLTNADDWVEVPSTANNAITYTNEKHDEIAKKVGKIQVPFLFLYNKDNTEKYEYDREKHEVVKSTDGEEGQKYPIVYGFEEMIDHTVADGKDKFYDGNSGLKKELTYNYAEKLDAFFKLVNQKELSAFTDADYIRYEYNTRIKADTINNGYDKNAFEEDEKINYHTLTYRQFIWLLKQEGNSLVLFAGSWCSNTQGIIRTVNDYAVENNVTVYTFDTKLYTGLFSARTIDYGATGSDQSLEAHIRESNDPLTPLYANLINNYLTNIVTLYDKTKEGQYIEYTEGNEKVHINKLQVPYLLAYNKDHKDKDGFSAPITGYHEQMVWIVPEIKYGDSTREVPYIYAPDTYAEYKAGVKSVIQAYGDIVGGITAKDITVDRTPKD